MTSIQVKDITCEFDRATPEADIEARAKSISGVGLIHSVKIQESLTEGKYFVVAGRKSFAALTTVLGKTELLVPSEVSLIEGDAELIAFAENDERIDLTLAEQIAKIEVLSERFGVAELATKLSHTEAWIAARIRLKELNEEWRSAMSNHSLEGFTIGHYEVVAKYPAEVQPEILNHCTGYGFDVSTIVALEKNLAEHFAYELTKLPWNKKGEYTGCGECPACVDRAGAGFLFADMDAKKVICQSKTYYMDGLNEYVLKRLEVVRVKEPDILLVSQGYMATEFVLKEDDCVMQYQWNEVKKDHKKAKHALVVYGPKVGKFIYIETWGQAEHAGEPGEKKAPKTLQERKDLLRRRRRRLAIDDLMTYLMEDTEYAVPDQLVVLQLIYCLGTKANSPVWFEGGLASFKKAGKLKNEDLMDDIWVKLLDEIHSNLKFGQKGSVEEHWPHALVISKIIGFNLTKAMKEATAALKEPTSWAALEAAE